MRIQRTINGEPYSFERNAHGFGVTNTSAPENNFYRSYQVYVGNAGIPTHCSCPDCYHKLHTCGLGKSNWCKHMREANRVLAETGGPEIFQLFNPKTGWRYTYKVYGENIIIFQDRDECEGEVAMCTKAEAREHYKQKWRKGYRPPAKES